MKKLKDLCISMLMTENEAVDLSPSSVVDVVDVDFNKAENYIKIDFSTPYDKTASLVAELTSFNSWLESNKDKYKDIFKQFAIDFISSSQETEGLNEIVDDNGDIMADDSMPNNATNSMVMGPKFDLEKIYKSLVPKSIRFYSGDWGVGIVTW